MDVLIDKNGLFTMKPSTEPNETQKEQIARKYGMFMHFGINTFANLEWSDGNLPLELYSPTAIEAEEWVKAAYEAGMNFIILITKHHDGFCLWDTKHTEYCINNTASRIDVVEEVSKACKKYNMKLGLYYSLWDEHEKSFKEDFENGYISYMLKQLTELFNGRYGEIVELWFDGAWKKLCPEWRYDLIYDLVKRLQPKCQIGINHTIGRPGLGDPEDRYKPENYQLYDPIRNFPSDFRLWDPYICRKDDPKLYTYDHQVYYLPYEQTICSREGFSWFFSDDYEKKALTSVDDIAESYRQLTEQDNLLVVNVPPNRNGNLVKSDVDNLLKVADRLGIRRHIESFPL
ncbi:MAG: calcium:sodium exchange protein [Herbinix sp.]|jgi:alpha-L-fucosidase|nr:calcium:sodium exchange protein [Herbinix sp.]